jgi:hypothetical protein
MGAKRIASLRERKLAVADHDESAEADVEQSSPGGRRRQAGQALEQLGVRGRRKLLDEHAFAGGMATAGKADGALHHRQGLSVPITTGGAHHRVESLQQGPRSDITAPPPGRRLVLPEQVAHPGGEPGECGPPLRAGNARSVVLRGGPSEDGYRFGFAVRVAVGTGPQQ